MDLKDIKAIIDLMRKNAVSELELEKQDFKIRLKRVANGGSSAVYQDDAPILAYATPQTTLAVPAPPVPQTAQPTSNEIDIKSPMVGTFYRAPTPEAAPYVDIGAEVGPETVVCIVEAMKVMNEIKAEARGVITQVLVENGKPIEFGQPLFRLRPS